MSATRATTILAMACAAALAMTASLPLAAQPTDPADRPLVVGVRTDVAPRAAAPRHFEDDTGDLPDEAITAIAVDPGDDQVVFAGLDGFLFRSDDGGDTWRPVLSFPRGTAIDDTEIDTADVTTDAADTAFDDVPSRDPGAGALDDDLPAGSAPGFDVDDLPEGDVVGEAADELVDIVAFARAGPGVRTLAFVPGSRGVFYVATPRGLYRTTTNGTSFDRLNMPGGVRENDVRDVAVDPARPSRLYVATAAGLVVSRDGGTSFQTAGGRVGSAATLNVAAESTTEGVLVLVGTERGLFRSIDGGQTFLEVLLRGLPPFSPITAVAISRDNGTYYAGTSQGLFVGERGASLLERYGGVPNVLVQAVSPDPYRLRAVAVGTRARGVLFSPDAGLTLDEGAEQVPAGEVLAFARGKTMDDLIVATERGVFRSAAGTGVVISERAFERLRAQWRQEPSLEEVARAAVAWNRLEGSVAGGMRERAGLAGWVPQVLARYQVVAGRTSRRDELILRLGDELPPGIDPNNDNRDLFGNVGAFLVQPPQDGLRQVVLVLATWNLDRALLNDDEIAAGRQSPQWWGAERRVLDRVLVAWAARRRLMTEMALGDAPRGKNAARDDVLRQLRVDELTAQLDAVTGGAFSERIGAADIDPGSRDLALHDLPDVQDVQEDSR